MALDRKQPRGMVMETVMIGGCLVLLYGLLLELKILLMLPVYINRQGTRR